MEFESTFTNENYDESLAATIEEFTEDELFELMQPCCPTLARELAEKDFALNKGFDPEMYYPFRDLAFDDRPGVANYYRNLELNLH